jgi:hypothetical protein
MAPRSGSNNGPKATQDISVHGQFRLRRDIVRPAKTPGRRVPSRLGPRHSDQRSGDRWPLDLFQLNRMMAWPTSNPNAHATPTSWRARTQVERDVASPCNRRNGRRYAPRRVVRGPVAPSRCSSSRRHTEECNIRPIKHQRVSVLLEYVSRVAVLRDAPFGRCSGRGPSWWPACVRCSTLRPHPEEHGRRPCVSKDGHMHLPTLSTHSALMPVSRMMRV